MKKVILILLILFAPIIVMAEENNCSKEQIIKYKNEIKDATIDISFKELKKGEDGDGDYYLVKPENLPQEFGITIYRNDSENSDSYFLFRDLKEIYLFSGGIYSIQIENANCVDEVLKSFDVLLPDINNQNETQTNDKKITRAINLKFIILILILLTIIVLGTLIGIFLVKRRGAKNENKS